MLPKVCRMNHKNLVFAENYPIRNSGRILRLFNCNDRVFFAIAGCATLLTLVSPIRVCPETLKKKGVFCLRA